MRIVTNEHLIKRNARMGQIVSLGGLVLLVAGLVISFTNPDQVGLSLAGLLLGFALSQIGIYLGNRYARVPRPDQALNDALKGMDRYHTLYHYIAPTAHLLAGPSGLWVLIVKPQRGNITYEKGRWRQRGGFGLAYMKIFAQESIGRPDLEIGGEVASMKKFLEKEIPAFDFPEPQAILAFSNSKVEVNANDAPIPTLPIKKIKEMIRKSAKDRAVRLSPEQLESLRAVLEADVRDEVQED